MTSSLGLEGTAVHPSVFFEEKRAGDFLFPETKSLGLAELAETSNVRPSVRAVAPKLIVRS